MSRWRVGVGVRDPEAFMSETARPKERTPPPPSTEQFSDAETSWEAVEEVRATLTDDQHVLYVTSS